jgi:serine/threonine protein kinase
VVKHIKSYGTGESGSTIVMELIDGMDLNKAIFKNQMFDDSIPKKTLHSILTQMAEAVRYCHCEKFMVHRDLHVGNWMITKDNKVKLIDFGIAQRLGKNGVSKEFWCTE